MTASGTTAERPADVDHPPVPDVPRRGRPRDARCDGAILQATLETVRLCVAHRWLVARDPAAAARYTAELRRRNLSIGACGDVRVAALASAP